MIEDTLQQVHWNRRRAAEQLGVSYKTLLNKIKECGILTRPPATGPWTAPCQLRIALSHPIDDRSDMDSANPRRLLARGQIRIPRPHRGVRRAAG